MRLNIGVQARSDRRDTHSGQQIVHLDAGALSGTVWQHFVGDQSAAAGRLKPPDAVIGKLRVALLKKIHHRQHEETDRGHGQQRRLQAIEETSLHEVSTLPFCLSTQCAMLGGCFNSSGANRQSTENT